MENGSNVSAAQGSEPPGRRMGDSAPRDRAPVRASDAEMRFPVSNEGADAFRVHREGDVIIAAAETLSPRIIVSGWACRMRRTKRQSRVIFSYLLPGNIIGRVRPGYLPAGASVVALTEVRIRGLTQDEGVRLHEGNGGLAEEVVRQDERLLLENVLRLTSLAARPRLCHFLLEVEERLAEVGLSDGHGFELPIRKTDMASGLGVSLQQLNRSLRELETSGVFHLASGHATIGCRRKLEDMADYSPRERSWPVHLLS